MLSPENFVWWNLLSVCQTLNVSILCSSNKLKKGKNLLTHVDSIITIWGAEQSNFYNNDSCVHKNVNTGLLIMPETSTILQHTILGLPLLVWVLVFDVIPIFSRIHRVTATKTVQGGRAQPQATPATRRKRTGGGTESWCHVFTGSSRVSWSSAMSMTQPVREASTYPAQQSGSFLSR